MNRDELTALRDVLDLILQLPDDLRAQVVAWLSPAAAKPNGLDLIRRRSPTMDKALHWGNSPLASEAGKAARTPAPGPSDPSGKPTPAQAAERKLLEALRDQSRIERRRLARLAGQSRSAGGERLRQLARRGTVEKDVAGRWRLKAEEAEAGPTAGRSRRRPPCRPDGGANTGKGRSNLSEIKATLALKCPPENEPIQIA